uniref:Nucleoporin Nup37 n=1 Tax=Glossina morsitans morsitans TaxID=37546 RepID=A0A1B0FLK1_GLOMM
MRSFTAPKHVFNFLEQITCFEMCSSQFASSLLCIAAYEKLILGFVRFPEETESESFFWEKVRDIHHETRCHALCFSPDTSLMIIPKNVTLCAAGSDFLLRIFRTDLENPDTVQTLKGHTNYVNEISWSNECEFLASVMVAEKKGAIHMYNVRSQQSVISVECPKIPLLTADWALNNYHIITALSGGEIVTFDMSRRPCSPTNVKPVHEDVGRYLRSSPSSEHVTASIGRPDITLKVFTANSTVPLIEATLKSCTGLSWHQRLPYVAAACDRKLCFWKVQTK